MQHKLTRREQETVDQFLVLHAMLDKDFRLSASLDWSWWPKAGVHAKRALAEWEGMVREMCKILGVKDAEHLPLQTRRSWPVPRKKRGRDAPISNGTPG